MLLRLVLQDKKTGLYLEGAKHWGPSSKTALDFANTTDAEQFCRDHGISEVRAIAHFRDTIYHFELENLVNKPPTSA